MLMSLKTFEQRYGYALTRYAYLAVNGDEPVIVPSGDNGVSLLIEGRVILTRPMVRIHICK